MQGGTFAFIYLVFKILDIYIRVGLLVGANGKLGMVC
jgi:hypothetical protein